MSAALYRCGHPRTAENSRIAGDKALCRICQNARHNAWELRKYSRLTPEQRYERHRRQYLRKQLPAARHKLAALEREAIRLGMGELVANPVQHGEKR